MMHALLCIFLWCKWDEKLDECCYMVTCGTNHYIGSTKYGRKFMESNLHLPVPFLSDVQNSTYVSVVFMLASYVCSS